MRKPSRKTLVKNLDKVCRQIVLQRDGHQCIRCGKYNEDGEGLQASHIIPKKRGHHVRWVPENIKILCCKCHFWWHTDPFAGTWFRELIKDDKDRLHRIDTLNQEQTKSFRNNDLIELLMELEEQL